MSAGSVKYSKPSRRYYRIDIQAPGGYASGKEGYRIMVNGRKRELIFDEMA